jgi:hypothetical protein
MMRAEYHLRINGRENYLTMIKMIEKMLEKKEVRVGKSHI